MTLWVVVQRVYLQMHLVSCTNTHHDVTDLVNHEMVKNRKTWISWERNITFLQIKKILNQCLRWHILRSYHFAVEVTFNRFSFVEFSFICDACWVTPVFPRNFCLLLLELIISQFLLISITTAYSLLQW